MRRPFLSLCLCLSLNGAADPPSLSPGAIVNAADHSGGRVAPGEIVVLFPSNAGPDTLLGAQLGADGKATTLLAGTRVLFDGVAAPLTYAMNGQVGAVVPYGVSQKATTQVVVEYQGVRSAPVTVPVVESAPALFTLDSSGKGQAGMLNEPGCCNSPRNPAIQGAIASLYATGAGQTVPAGIDGSVPAFDKIADYPAPRMPVRVTVGGKPCQITYAAAAPHAVAGLVQVNFRVPPDAPVGDVVPLVLWIGNTHSPDGVTMAVRSPTRRVLLIESDVAIRRWLTMVLSDAGLEVFSAPNGPIDLVISDLAHDRIETVRGLRAEHPQLRIIATATALTPDVLKSADMLGAQAILTKPYGPKTVMHRVSEILRSRPATYFATDDPRR